MRFSRVLTVKWLRRIVRAGVLILYICGSLCHAGQRSPALLSLGALTQGQVIDTSFSTNELATTVLSELKRDPQVAQFSRLGGRKDALIQGLAKRRLAERVRDLRMETLRA